MVDLPKPERKAPLLDEMTPEELLGELKTGCVVQGKKKKLHPDKETQKVAEILKKRGAKPKTIRRLMGAYRDIGKYQDRPVRPRFPGDLPVNESLQGAIKSAEKSVRTILAFLSPK
jgi:hypothetical protein